MEKRGLLRKKKKGKATYYYLTGKAIQGYEEE